MLNECRACCDPRALLQVLQVLAAAIEGEVGGIINDTSNVHVGLHNFDFLGNSVLAEADAQLARAMPGERSRHSCSGSSMVFGTHACWCLCMTSLLSVYLRL